MSLRRLCCTPHLTVVSEPTSRSMRAKESPGVVVAQVVSFNQVELLPICLSALRAQTYQPLAIMVADNASTDGSGLFIQRNFPGLQLHVHSRNLGYGAAHNAMLRQHRAHFVLVLNVDVRLAPTYVEELVRVLGERPEVGMAQGKLLQWDTHETNRIDNVGVCLHRNRRNDLLGYGETDLGQYDRPMEIFGCDGAAALYRREMLEDIRQGEGEYFDESFFLFREDVDVAWRARWLGWRAWYVPTSVAWHVRRYKPASRRRQPRPLRRLQLRNRYFLLVKHESGAGGWRDLWPWCWFELRALAYTAIVEPHYWLSYVDVLRHLPQLWRKRRQMVRHRRVGISTLRQWIHDGHA